MCSHWWLTFGGIVVAISAFMVLYFVLLEHPQHAVTEMPLLVFDHWVRFTPWALVPYVSLWIYIGLVPSLLWLKGEMPRYLLAAVLLAGIGCVVFYFWPTRVPDFPVDWSRWRAVELLKQTDAAGNACPSLHVGFAVLTLIWLQRLLRHVRAPRWMRGVNVVWCLLIVWSTMATRQHVALDVIAGGALGGAIAVAGLYRHPFSVADTGRIRI